MALRTRWTVVLALAPVLAGCSGLAATSAPASIAPAAPASAAPSVVTPAFAPIELRGKGSKGPTFTIPEGSAAIATFTHPGRSNFIVDSIAADGSQIQNLVNASEPYAGTVLLDAPGGDHAVAFRIDTTGTWKATIEPVTSARTWRGVGMIKGTGDDLFTVIPPTGDGVAPWHVEHEGASHFVVDAFGSGGQENLVDRTGDYSGDIRVPGHTYLMTVHSEGIWSVSLLE